MRRPPWSEFRAALDAAGFRPSKTLGQNFLLDDNMARAIAADAGVGPGDRVLEVGTGCGFLTLHLAGLGVDLSTLEVDPRLHAVAAGLLQGLPNVRLLLGDALSGKHELGATLLEAIPAREPWHLVANLPYGIAGPLLVLLARHSNPPRTMTALVQREVAERVAARPGTRAWGALPARLAVAYGARAGRIVPAHLFWPRPRVESRVVHLGLLPEPPGELGAFDALVDGLFQRRRKTLGTSLACLLGGQEAAQGLLEAVGIDPGLRPERLGAAELLALARHPAWRGR